VLLRKYEIRRCFVFPPHLSSASAIPCERGSQKTAQWCFCVQHSPTAAALSTCFLLNHAPQKPRAERIDYRIQGVIQQCWYESWVKNIEEIKQGLVEFWQRTNKAIKNAIFIFLILPDNAEAQVIWGGVVKRFWLLTLSVTFLPKNIKIRLRVSKL